MQEDRLQLYEALEQAVRDSREGEKPVVMHRKNNCEWVAILRLEDFCEILREWSNR